MSCMGRLNDKQISADQRCCCVFPGKGACLSWEAGSQAPASAVLQTGAQLLASSHLAHLLCSMGRQPGSGPPPTVPPQDLACTSLRFCRLTPGGAPALQTAEAALKEVQKSVAGFKAPQGKDLSTALRQYAEVAQGGRWNLKQEIRGAAEQERERLEAALAGTKPRNPSGKRSAERSPLGRPHGTPGPGVTSPEEAPHSGKGPEPSLPGGLLSSAGWPVKQAVERGRSRASCLWEACSPGCCASTAGRPYLGKELQGSCCKTCCSALEGPHLQ